MAATNRKADRLSSQRPKSTNPLDACDRTIRVLSREASAVRRQLSSSARQGEGFSRVIEKIEDQLHFAQRRLGRKPSDLDMNEVAIVAEKVSDELEELVPSSYGAAVASESRYIKREFSELKKLLGKMRLQAAEMKKKARKSKCKPGKIAILSFTNHARLFRAKLARASKMLKSKDSREYKRLFSALGEAEGLSVRAEELLLATTKARLKGKIGDTKTEIMGFVRRAGSGRVFLDHKHLTLRSGPDRLTLSFSPEVRYCLEEMAPISHWLHNIGKNAVLVGRFEQHNSGALLKIGERAVVGNSIVYRECTVMLN